MPISEELDNTSIQEIFATIENLRDDAARMVQVKRAWVKIIGARKVRRSMRGVLTASELQAFDAKLKEWEATVKRFDCKCLRCGRRSTYGYCEDCA